MDYVVSMICHASATSLSVVSTHCYTYISQFSVNPHHRQKRKSRRRCHRNSVPNRFSSRFLTSPTNGPRSLSQTKMGTHSALGERSHTRAHTEKQGCFGWGGVVSLPSDCFTRFGNPAWPGGRTANFAAFGSWSGVLSKNAESLRNSDALMRVAAPRRRGPAGLSSPAVVHSACLAALERLDQVLRQSYGGGRPGGQRHHLIEG